MIDIEMSPMRSAFFECWAAAGNHLQGQIDGGMGAWLKSYPFPPFLEHLSFRLGNQLFFVRVEDEDNQVNGPSSRKGLRYIASENNGHACLLTMKHLAGVGWTSSVPGWGLTDIDSGEPINPVLSITDEKIEMTKWELQDMGVQVVRDFLENEGYELMSWQGNPNVDPSIWFVGESKTPEWVVVRVTKYPSNRASRPENWDSIAASCSKMSSIGHFASVALMWANQPSGGESPISLPRGEGMIVSFRGLESEL